MAAQKVLETVDFLSEVLPYCFTSDSLMRVSRGTRKAVRRLKGFSLRSSCLNLYLTEEDFRNKIAQMVGSVSLTLPEVSLCHIPMHLWPEVSGAIRGARNVQVFLRKSCPELLTAICCDAVTGILVHLVELNESKIFAGFENLLNLTIRVLSEHVNYAPLVELKQLRDLRIWDEVNGDATSLNSALACMSQLESVSLSVRALKAPEFVAGESRNRLRILSFTCPNISSIDSLVHATNAVKMLAYLPEVTDFSPIRAMINLTNLYIGFVSLPCDFSVFRFLVNLKDLIFSKVARVDFAFAETLGKLNLVAVSGVSHVLNILVLASLSPTLWVKIKKSQVDDLDQFLAVMTGTVTLL